MTNLLHSRLLACFAVGLVALASPAARAVDYTWNGAGSDNNWSTAANWISGTVPVAANTNNLVFAGTTRLSPVNDLAANSRFLAIQFSAGAGNFSLSGNTIRLGDYGGASNVITNAGSNLSLTIDNAIAFNETNPSVLAGSSGNTLTLNGLLTNGTGSAISEFRVAQGLVNFTNSANSMTGVFAAYGSGTAVFSNIANGGVASAVGSGTAFRLGNANSVGALRYTGPTVSTDRRIQFGSNTAGSTGAGTIQADGSGAITFSNAAFNYSAGTTNDTTKIVTLSGSNTADNTISGVIIDNDTDSPIAIAKSGVGRWVLAGNSTYTGTTTVSAGTLVIAHANALGGTAAGTTVSAGAALGLQGGITTANEALTISGTGISGDGALLNVSGNNTYSGAVTLGADSIVGATSGTLTLASAVSGGFGLTKAGAGTVVLNVANTYTGTTAVSGGVLRYGVNDALAAGAVTIDSGATLDVGTFSDSVGTVTLTSGNIIGTGTLTSTGSFAVSSGTISAPLAGAVGLTKTGAGTVELNASNTYAGLTTINGGVLRLGANQTSATSSVTVTSGTLDLNGSTMNLQSVATQKGLLLGGGAAGTRAYVSTGSGTMVIQSGTGVFPWVQYSATNNPLGAEVAGNLRIISGTGNGFTGFMADDSSATDEELTISAVISGTLGNVYSQIAGTVVFTGLNTYASTGYQLRGGTWVLGTNAMKNQPGALGNTSQNVNVGHASTNLDAALLLREGVATDRTMVITTATSNPFGLTRTIGGTFTSGTATFSGGMTVNTNARLTAAAGGTVVLGGSILNGSTNLQSGTISKVGLGTFIVTGSNSTTFPWLVQAGKLLVNGTNSGGGAVTVDAGAILGGSGRIDSLVTVSGTLSPGNSPGVLTLSSLALTPTATTFMEINGLTRGSDYDGIDITTSSGLTYDGLLSVAFGLGGAVADNTTFNLFNFSGSPSGSLLGVSSSGFYAGTWQTAGSGTWQLQQGSQTLTFSQATGDIIVVPEPGTLALAAAAVGLAAAWARRRRPCSG
jgi:autotransporter-associated beta strand protein